MLSMADHLNGLARLLEAGDVLRPDNHLQAYEHPARGPSGRAACVVRPRTSKEVSDVLAYCLEHELGLIVQSGHTGLVNDGTPDHSGSQIVLSLEKMRGVFEYNALNRTLRVSAGFKLSEINSRLEEEGVFLPIDLGADPMVGGLVATNTGGSRLLHYGDVRRHALAIDVVLASQQAPILTLGSACRKDNSATDWKHLFIGSGALFGVICECTFELARRPVAQEAALLAPRDDAAIDEILLELEKRVGSRLSAFESMSINAVRHALDHVPGLKPPFARNELPEQLLLVEISQNWPQADGAPALADQLLSIIEEIWALPGEPLKDARFGKLTEMWALRHALSEGLRGAGEIVAFDLSFTRDRINAFRNRARQEAADRFAMLELCDFGHVGDGGVHLNFVAPFGVLTPDLKKEIEDWAYHLAVVQFDGSFSAEHGIGRKNQRIYNTYAPSGVKTLSRAFKSTIAPGKIGGFTA